MVGFISELKIIKVRETRESYALQLNSVPCLSIFESVCSNQTQ